MFLYKNISTSNTSHVGSSLRVIVSENRNNTHISNAEILHAPHAEMRVNSSVTGIDLAHLHCAGHVPTRREEVLPELEDVLVGIRRGPDERGDSVLREALLATNFQQVSVDLDTGATIERILKEPRVEQQRDFWVGGLQAHFAAGLFVHQECRKTNIAVIFEHIGQHVMDGQVGDHLVVGDGFAVHKFLHGCWKCFEFGRGGDAV